MLSSRHLTLIKLQGKASLVRCRKSNGFFQIWQNIANDLGKEIMLYASGTRQINRAMKIGVHNGMNNIALVCIGEDIDLSEFDDITHGNVLQYDISKESGLMDIFNNNGEEARCAGEDKIPELVIERVALVDVLK